VSDQAVKSQQIQVGDIVAYRLSIGERAYDTRGTVIGLVTPRFGRMYADVKWDRIGLTTRVAQAWHRLPASYMLSSSYVAASTGSSNLPCI
jgi:hypothetical protein